MNTEPIDETAQAAAQADTPKWPLNRWFSIPFIIVLFTDIASKAWVFANYQPDFPQWISPAFNPGVAWSMFADTPWFVVALTVVLIPIIITWYWKTMRGIRTWEDLSFGLIIGGALGNAWDRVWSIVPGSDILGVRDFIHVDLNVIGISYIWPPLILQTAGSQLAP